MWRRAVRQRGWGAGISSTSCAGVTLRVWMSLITVGYASATGADNRTAFLWGYVIVPFLCWVPNLLFAEWLVLRRGLPAFRFSR